MARFTGKLAFWSISSGQLVSSVGSGMTRFGLSLWVLTETGDVAAYTALLFFAFLPVGLGSLIAGPVVDRLDRRSVMLTANTLASTSTLAIAVLHFSDTLELWHLFVALFVNGFANSFVLPSFEASVPLLMPRDQLGRAAGFTQMIMALETIAAPALAGLVVAGAGIGLLFIIDFVTFGFALTVLTLSRIPNPEPTDAHPQEAIVDAFRTGLRYLRERPPMLRLFAFITLLMLMNAGFGFALCTPLVMSFADETAAGLVMSSFGVGALIGGFALAATGGPKPRMHGILAALVCAAFASLVIASVESVAVVAAGVTLIGATFMFVMGLVRVIIQEKTPPQVLGRVSSLRMALGTGAQVIGIALAGPVAEAVFEPLMAEGGALAPIIGPVLGVGDGRGIALMYVIIGIALLALTILAALSRRTRGLEDELPDAVAAA